MKHKSFLDRRRCGILLHPSSLPGKASRGVFGPEAYQFIDFLAASGFSVWQTLPLGPTHADNSPYQCLSVHAGNPGFISLELLVEEGWLEQNSREVLPLRYTRTQLHVQLKKARQGFLATAPEHDLKAYQAFTAEQSHWLEDYALFQALRHNFRNQHWLDWPQEYRDREQSVINHAREEWADAMEQVRFEQFVFFRQWQGLKRYANTRDILLFGDLPIFVAHDSADVWANKEQFALNEEGKMIKVAGVPPDYFSATGQLWGNPHYHWKRMQADDFQWWQQRLRTQLQLFDLIRIDHFRGFESYWAIPADAPTAIHGQWVKAPGNKLFATLHQCFNPLPVVAEDLGLITPQVIALRRRHGFPGMKILQFAFDGNANNPYLPHSHEINSVVYTGTHDNNTTLGWYQSLPEEIAKRVCEYLGDPQQQMPWPLIRCALASVARLAMIPMQDVLALDGAHRMNTPGTTVNNWQWRFTWEQVDPELAARLRHMVEVYGR